MVSTKATKAMKAMKATKAGAATKARTANHLDAVVMSKEGPPACQARCNAKGYCLHRSYCMWKLWHTQPTHMCDKCASDAIWV